MKTILNEKTSIYLTEIIITSILRLLIRLFGIILKPFSSKKKKTEITECLMVSYCGYNNTGAEAKTSEAIKQICEALDYKIHINLFTLNKKNTSRYIKEDSYITIRETHPLYLIKNSLLIAKSDVVILVEGITFQDNFGPVLLLCYLYIAGLAQRLSKKTVAYGVDAKINSSVQKPFVRDIANKMDLIMVRTEESAQNLKELGVTNNIHVTTDSAFQFESKSNNWVQNFLQDHNINSDKPLIGIAFREFFWWPFKIDIFKFLCGIKTNQFDSIIYYTWDKDSQDRSDRFKQAIAKYADWCVRTYDANILFMAFEEMDIAPCNDIINLMETETTIIDSTNYCAQEITAIARNLDFCVTTRYHFIILSLLSAVPFIGISHDNRIKGIMKELELSKDYYIDYLEENLLQKLQYKTKLLFQNKFEISSKIKSYYPNYVERMNKNIKLFTELVKNT